MEQAVSGAFGLFVVAWLACAIYTGAIAQAKGRSGLAWVVGGLCFGLIALIAVVGVPTWREEVEIKRWLEDEREARDAARQQRRLRPAA